MTAPDVIVIGAGVAGLYQLYRLRALGLEVRTRWTIGRKGVTFNDRGRGLGLVNQALRWAFRQDSLLSMVGAPLRAFVRSREGLAAPDLLLGWVPMFTEAGPRGPRIARQSGVSCYAHPMRPESKGHIHIVSADARKAPEIRFNFLKSASDWTAMLEGLRICREIGRQPALAPFVVEEILPGAGVTDEAGLREHIRANGVSNLHPVGTCRMGRAVDDVVDPELRVYGIDGLRVADASIMPTLTSGNTNAPSIMIGEKAADMVLEDAA